MTCAAILAGCMASTPSSVVATRAAHDFHCDEDDIKVENIGGKSYAATGCGHERTYDCVGSMRMDVGLTCVPEDDSSK